MSREYTSAAAFKQSLEHRLREGSTSGVNFDRKRQLAVYDRMLARLSAEFGDKVTLKGGLAVEFRTRNARSTKDIDLSVNGPSGQILSRLRSAAARDLGDFMVFIIHPDDRHPEIQNDGMLYDGKRFRAECTLAGKPYGRPFGIDVVFGDAILGEPTIFVASDTFGFAQIEPPTLRLYPIETHIAEKLHAYTMPRLRPNSRVKDLPDLALIATSGPIEAPRLRAAIEKTFDFRATHPVPSFLPEPAESWAAPYRTMATDNTLRWSTLPAVYEAAQRFLDPVLDGTEDGVWNPTDWVWG